MEGKHPPVRFEIHHELSTRYTIQVAPEIREGELTFTVATVRMNYNAGAASKDWTLDYETETTLNAEVADDLQGLARLALEEVFHQHANLMEEVGLRYYIARDAAEKAWSSK